MAALMKDTDAAPRPGTIISMVPSATAVSTPPIKADLDSLAGDRDIEPRAVPDYDYDALAAYIPGAGT